MQDICQTTSMFVFAVVRCCFVQSNVDMAFHKIINVLTLKH